jgi:hypothetical protein
MSVTNVNEEPKRPYVPDFKVMTDETDPQLEQTLKRIMTQAELSESEIDALQRMLGLIKAVRGFLAHRAADTKILARADITTVQFHAQKDGYLRVGSNSMGGSEALKPGQWIEARWADGLVVITRCG